MLKSEDIANISFRKANFGGYRPEDVDIFIDQVQAAFDQIQKEKADLSRQVEELTQTVEEYRNDEESIRTTLLSAQKLADASIREAKHKAEVILKDASAKAEKIISGAHTDVVEQQKTLEQLQTEVANFRTRLIAVYREHITLINALPTGAPVETKQRENPFENAPVKQEPVAAPMPQETEVSMNTEEDGFKVKQPGAASVQEDPAASQQNDKFRSLKFGENYDISKDEEESPIGLFKRGNK